MTMELEEMLVRELGAVAGGVEVPPLPSVIAHGERPVARRLWQPLLGAAAVALIVGLAVLLVGRQGDDSPQPAPSPSVPTPTNASPTPGKVDSRIPVTPPTVPYVLDQVLYVDGAAVPGAWQGVESRGGVWLAQRYDLSWWWGGPGVAAGRIEADLEQPPVLSPDGHYVAFLDLNGGATPLTGFTTTPGGEGLGAAPVEIPRTEGGVHPRVRAVTDEGDVVVQGTRTSVLWRSQETGAQAVVDLTGTAADQVVLQGSAAGLVVVDGAEGATDATDTEPYLADLSTTGDLTITGTLPTYDDLEISPGGTWLVRAPAGSIGGEVAAIATLRAQPVGAGAEITLSAPARWAFATNSWAWEDDETLVAVLVPTSADGQAAPRLVRCSVTLEACRAFSQPGTQASGTPGAEASGEAGRSYTAEEALDAVAQAVVDHDRPSLVDQAVVDDGMWKQLVDFAANGGVGAVPTCRDNGSGTKDCEIPFQADPATTYYAILTPSPNSYGWRISYVGVGGA